MIFERQASPSFLPLSSFQLKFWGSLTSNGQQRCEIHSPLQQTNNVAKGSMSGALPSLCQLKSALYQDQTTVCDSYPLLEQSGKRADVRTLTYLGLLKALLSQVKVTSNIQWSTFSRNLSTQVTSTVGPHGIPRSPLWSEPDSATRLCLLEPSKKD